MQYVNLLGVFDTSSELDSFAKEFFSAVGVSSYEERESGNFPDGRYFRNLEGVLAFTISLSDEEDHEDLPFWIQVSADMSSLDELVSAVDSIVLEKAMPAGFCIARMINLGKKNEQRINY
ncbi:hypothetical protein GCM10007907_28000 [Chitinimonas prasina]|uniref:Uncharacterized protein n=1 Tax=Chitinimonas prasina TaxID=1434937 RepID=A0ABQ5YG92_9NEIS|nr:hypothetical protein [Chitinimonas prasina]GLR14010.1 hypothetical protein GCM10007907_28000 [Chitinimonas prasina]